MSGGGNKKNQPEFPDEVKQLWAMAEPMARRMGAAGLGGKSLWDVPGPVLPTSEWYQGIAPEVKAGICDPRCSDRRTWPVPDYAPRRRDALPVA